MLKIFYAGCLGLGLSPAVSSPFTPEMCAAAKMCEKFTENPYFGSSRSFKIIDANLKNPSPVLVMINNISVPIHNRFPLYEPKAAK